MLKIYEFSSDGEPGRNCCFKLELVRQSLEGGFSVAGHSCHGLWNEPAP